MSLVKTIGKYIPVAISAFGAIIFLDSLRYKFTNAEETQVIFGKLNAWAASFGANGLFAQTGLFSQYVIGSAELLASALLLIGLIPGLRRLNALGALIAFSVMMGAVNFHLWTPLGVDPNNDGGGLFVAAFILLLGSAVLLFIRRHDLAAIGAGLARVLVPGPVGFAKPTATEQQPA